MRAYLLNLWDAIRGSFWFVPALFALAAVALAGATPWLDGQLAGDVPDWMHTNNKVVQPNLSTITGAMIGVTGTVFSITVVALSLTSQQFGPRLLRRFMYDFPTQLALGVFLGTALYSLLLLRVMARSSSLPELPIAVLVADLLAVASLAVLIFFIHHTAKEIQAPQVVAGVAGDLDEALDRLFPDPLGDDILPQTSASPGAIDEPAAPPILVESPIEGYIQSIDEDALVALACEHGLRIHLRTKPGAFLAKGDCLAAVWQLDGRALGDTAQGIGQAFITGARRTPRQDLECAIDELGEVAVRSLSPGINDPYTAISCIDRLGASLGRLAQRRMPSAMRRDSEGRLRLVVRPASFPPVLEAAFDQVRQAGRTNVSVTIRLLEALTGIARRARRGEDLEAVLRHAEMIVRHCEVIPEPNDRKEIQARYGELVRVVESAGA